MSKLYILLIIVCAISCAFGSSLPDFKGDANNTLKDCETNQLLEPGIPVVSGYTWQYASPTQVDWNGDGLFDLLVGYNVKNIANNPAIDSLKLVVYINQGSIGGPMFTGRPSDTTCFLVEIKYPGQNFMRPFSALGAHPTPNSDYIYPRIDWHTWLGFVPSIFDWNNDGLFDILISIGACDPRCGLPQVVTCTEIWDKPGTWLLVNTGTSGHPKFEKAANLNINSYNTGITGDAISSQEFSGLSLFRSMTCDGNFPQVTLVDWNSDGVIDIQSAVRGATVVYGKKDSTGKWMPQKNEWSESQKPFPLTTAAFGHHPLIRIADFDNDGINEILASSSQDSEMRLFRRLPDSAGQARYGNDTLLYKVADGRWHQKFDILDFDEDGDKDVLCGWGRGFTGGKGIWLYRTPNGIAGSLPFAFSEKGKVQNSGLSISTSPNPSAGSAVVRWNRGASAHSSKIDIIDIMGRTIKSIVPSVMNGATKINFSELSGKNGSLQTGIYFIRITTGKHSISIRHLNIR